MKYKYVSSKRGKLLKADCRKCHRRLGSVIEGWLKESKSDVQKKSGVHSLHIYKATFPIERYELHIYKSSEGRITWSQIREEVLAGWMWELRRVSFKTEMTYIVYIYIES